MLDMEISKNWVPVSLVRDIELGASKGTVVNGDEIVIWRDMAGAVHIWEDRCPHRGMKLSFGFVRGDHIACLYHGWEFGPDGNCRKIPAHPDLDVPSSICAKIYPAQEKFGMVWVGNLSGDGLSDDKGFKSPISLTQLNAADADHCDLRSIYINAPLSKVHAAIANIFDKDVKMNSFCVTVRYEKIDLIMGLQPISQTKSAIHIVGVAPLDLAVKKDILDKAKYLRLSLEQEEVA